MKKVVVEIHSEMNDDFEYEVFKTKIKVSNDSELFDDGEMDDSYDEWDEIIEQVEDELDFEPFQIHLVA
jgi:hypothetical protein